VFTPSLTIGALLARASAAAGLDVVVLAGHAGLDRRLTVAAVQKTGLALAGFEHFLRPGRLLVFGESEMSYLAGLEPSQRAVSLRQAFEYDVPAVLITSAAAPPPELIDEANRSAIPLLRTSLSTPVAITKVMALLEDRLAPRDTVHGVLLDILGLGVLIVGESGIGKSECALDLVVRGHRLVADDAVEVRRRAESVVIGTCPGLTRHHMEIRGLGVINVRDIFGVASTRGSKRVELVVQLERWDPGLDYERLGLDEATYDVLGLPIPLVRMPVAPGRNVAILVEVAARNQLLRARGLHAARALVERADERLRQRTVAPDGDAADADDGADLEDGR
jgi:HPr kinase/phosphorylase